MLYAVLVQYLGELKVINFGNISELDRDYGIPKRLPSLLLRMQEVPLIHEGYCAHRESEPLEPKKLSPLTLALRVQRTQ